MNNFCIGTANWQQGYGVDVSFDDCQEILNCAKKNNIIYIDTAQSYSEVESLLGNIGVSKFNLITKLPHDYRHRNFDELLKIVQSSLHKLNTKSLYGLLSHNENIYNYDRFLKDMQKLKGEGFINNIGVSIYSPEKAIDYVVEPDIDIVQVPFNVMDRRLLDNCFFMAAKEKQIFIRSIFLRGVLVMSGKEIKNNNMLWIENYLTRYYKFLLDYRIDAHTFCLGAVIETVSKLCRSSVFIIGVDNYTQLKNNINLQSIGDTILNQWWDDLLNIPEKVLNPSLWKK